MTTIANANAPNLETITLPDENAGLPMLLQSVPGLGAWSNDFPGSPASRTWHFATPSSPV
jgi:hypothetical protein